MEQSEKNMLEYFHDQCVHIPKLSKHDVYSYMHLVHLHIVKVHVHV